MLAFSFVTGPEKLDRNRVWNIRGRDEQPHTL
jgi:hypothetical protein